MESMEDPFKERAEISEEAALTLALQRDRELDSGQIKPVAHEEMMVRLRER